MSEKKDQEYFADGMSSARIPWRGIYSSQEVTGDAGSGIEQRGADRGMDRPARAR
jgi:hypothetical protein